MNAAWDMRTSAVAENALTPEQIMEKMGRVAEKFGHAAFCDMMTAVNNALGCESAVSRMIRKQATHDRAIELQVRHQMKAVDIAAKRKENKR